MHLRTRITNIKSKKIHSLSLLQLKNILSDELNQNIGGEKHKSYLQESSLVSAVSSAVAMLRAIGNRNAPNLIGFSPLNKD